MVTQLRCSRYASFLTFFMIPFPVTYLIFSILIFDLDSKGILSLVLSPLFYLSSLFWIVTGIGLRKLKKWSWYTFLFAQFFITYLNALNLVQHSNSEYKGLAFAFTILIQIYVFVVASKELRTPYLFPKIKWWESGIAGMPHLAAEVHHLGGVMGNTSGQILDINAKGCFVKTPHDFDPFEKISIRLQVFNQDVEVPGTVIWNAKSTVTHPKGIGVRFGDMNRPRRRSLRVIVRNFIVEKDPKNAKRLSE